VTARLEGLLLDGSIAYCAVMKRLVLALEELLFTGRPLR
jgi:hypothetical protein